MAAPMFARLTGVFILACLADLPLTGGNAPENGDVQIEYVTTLDLEALVQTREHVLAFFYDGICEDYRCKKALEELEQVLQDSTLPALKIVKINDEEKAKEYGVENLPNLIFFHNGSPNLYPEHRIEVEAVIEWVEGTPDELIQALDDSNFEHLTQAATGATTGDWLIIFYKPSCSQLLPTLRAVANRLRHRVVVARVEISKSPELVRRFKISSCPTLKFFRLGKMYEYGLPKYDVHTIVKYAEGWYKNSRSSKVPQELSPFDHLVESIALSLKEAVQEGPSVPLLIGGGMTILIFVLFLACCCMGGSSREKKD